MCNQPVEARIRTLVRAEKVRRVKTASESGLPTERPVQMQTPKTLCYHSRRDPGIFSQMAENFDVPVIFVCT